MNMKSYISKLVRIKVNVNINMIESPGDSHAKR